MYERMSILKVMQMNQNSEFMFADASIQVQFPLLIYMLTCPF